MKTLLKLLLAAPLLFLAACKKDNGPSSAGLSISGFTAGIIASGDAISIYGTGFDPNAANDAVLFDGVAGEVATASANRLEVIVPQLIDDGKITVSVGGHTIVSTQTYSVANVLQGTYPETLVLSPDKKWLLRGNVVFNGKLVIQAGTVIYGEKLTHGGMTAGDIDFQGTAANPIVFTSDQVPGDRNPGDWSGLKLASGETGQSYALQDPLGYMEYTRIEYAGYHAPDLRGVALHLSPDPYSTIRYIQVSYSAGDAFEFSGVWGDGKNVYLDHLVAFGCWGDDFYLDEMIGLDMQYGLGIKDPYNADPVSSNGIGTNGGEATISNFTLVGYNPSTRNIGNANIALNNNAGAAVRIGEYNYYGTNNVSGSYSDALYLYNSLLVGGWQAGVAIYTNGNWNAYEDSIPNSEGNITEDVIRYNYLVGTAPALYPYRGGVFGRTGNTVEISQTGYDDVTATPQFALFASTNDTSHVLDFTTGRDDLGIKGLADYSQMNHPSLVPPAGSPLLQGALFPASSPLNDPNFNKDVTYVGAFSNQDWTTPWCNFNPQQTQY
jgi:IPT/TIG domain